MTEEDSRKREEERLRGERARQILDDPMVTAAMADIKAAILDQWRSSPVKEVELREWMHQLYIAVHKVEELLRSHIETGKLARHQLTRDASRPV